MNNFNIQYPMSNIQCPMRRQRGIRGQSYELMLWMWMALLASGVGASAEDKARSAFDDGVNAFAASNYAAAGESFEEAAAAAPAEKLDPAAAHYNAALSAYAAGDLHKASTSFASAAAGSDLDLQAKAYYNRGNALFHLANAPAVQGAPQAAALPTNALDLGEAAIGQAIQMYENAIALNPKDTDAKANYELAVLKQQEIQQQKQQQQQQKDQQNQDEKKEDQKDQQQNQQQDQQKQEQQQKEQQEQNQQQAKEQDSKKEQAKEAQPEKPSEEMTPEEAATMLDAMKAQEQSQRDQLHPFFGRPVPVEKDW